MRVAFAPNFFRINPYQRLLAEALRTQGVSVDMVDFDPSARFPLLRLVSRLHGHYDALHIHWLHRAYAAPDFSDYCKNLCRLRLELAWLKRFGKLPLFYTAHNLHAHDARCPAMELAIHRQLVLLSRNTFVHSRAAHERLVNAYTPPANFLPRIVEIEHGNYKDVYTDDSPPATARRALKLADDALVFLAFGVVRGYKNLTDLLEVFTQWGNPKAVLVIAGEAKDTMVANRLRERAESDPRVRLMLNPCPDSQVPGLFAAADACVVAHDWQLTSGSLILAMGMGKPLLLPDRSLAGESPPLSGNITAAGGWRHALETFSALSTQARLDCGAANKSAAAQLSWQRTAERTARAYRNAL